MADTTTIEWTDATWTPVRASRVVQDDDGGGTVRIGWHCEHVSEGCRNCYAEAINKRLGTARDFKPAHLVQFTPRGDRRGDVSVFLDEKMLLVPLQWNRGRRVFVCSMTDLFAKFVPDDIIDRVFAVMALARQHRFQVLTKRSTRMREYFNNPATEQRISSEAHRINGSLFYVNLPMHNVQLGVSAEDQPNADARITDLLATPAALRFVSLEPLLGPIDLTNIQVRVGAGIDVFSALEYDGHPGDDVEFGTATLDWVIVGGESGPNARPMHPDWARSLRDQCAAAGVPFLHKQNGAYASVSDVPGNGGHFIFPDGTTVRRVGKKAAGRLLDGVEHNGIPS